MNVAVIGCGLRGSIVAALLAGAGAREISLVDGGFIEQSDLGSGPLVFTPDVNAGKADALAAKLGLIAPDALAVPFPAELNADNAEAILLGAGVVVDCSGSTEVAAALVPAAESHAIEIVSPPSGYDAASVSPARAVEVAGIQAGRAIELLG